MDFAISCSRVIGPYRTPGSVQSRRVAAEPLRLRCFGYFQYFQDIAFEVCPAELPCALVVLQISGTAVAAKNSGEYVTQQLNQHFGPAREGYLIEDEVRRHQSPSRRLYPLVR
jgi:hypothetical protein